MLGAQVMKKYINSLDYIRGAVKNGILPNEFLDLSFQWQQDLGRLTKSQTARRNIDSCLAEVRVRQQQEASNVRKGRVVGGWPVV